MGKLSLKSQMSLISAQMKSESEEWLNDSLGRMEGTFHFSVRVSEPQVTYNVDGSVATYSQKLWLITGEPKDIQEAQKMNGWELSCKYPSKVLTYRNGIQ